jgi:hypothetical protein
MTKANGRAKPPTKSYAPDCRDDVSSVSGPEASANTREVNVVQVVVPVELPDVRVLGCDAQWATVEVSLDARVVRVSGPPGRIALLARKLLDAVVVATDAVGDRCEFCGRRGLNNGRFAVSYGGGHAHVGCLEDHRHADRALHP